MQRLWYYLLKFLIGVGILAGLIIVLACLATPFIHFIGVATNQYLIPWHLLTFNHFLFFIIDLAALVISTVTIIAAAEQLPSAKRKYLEHKRRKQKEKEEKIKLKVQQQISSGALSIAENINKINRNKK